MASANIVIRWACSESFKNRDLEGAEIEAVVMSFTSAQSDSRLRWWKEITPAQVQQLSDCNALDEDGAEFGISIFSVNEEALRKAGSALELEILEAIETASNYEDGFTLPALIEPEKRGGKSLAQIVSEGRR